MGPQEEAAEVRLTAMDNWEIVETVGTEEEASLVAGFLEAEGIASQVESLLFHQEPATFGGLSEVRILVHANDVERARQLIAEREDSEPSEGDVQA
jgi:formate dehydrogenase assembly factor FdhD